VFQLFNRFLHKTMLENVTLAPIPTKGMAQPEAKRRAMDLLEMVGTALRVAEVAEAIAAAIARPVVASNQASVWRCLRLAGVGRPLPGHGQLLRQPEKEDA
jgi:maleate cis-trans isomerase